MTDQLDHLRRQNKRYKSIAITALSLWAVIATVASGSLVVSYFNDQSALGKSAVALNHANKAIRASQRQQAAQNAQLLQNCSRGNQRIVSDNISHRADFRVFSFIADRFLVPTKTETPKQIQITHQFGNIVLESVKAKTWSPLVDCKQAVAKQGPAYTQPPTYSFSVRKPPSSVLNVSNGKLLQPVGGISR